MTTRANFVIRLGAMIGVLVPAIALSQNPPSRGDDPAGAARYLHELRAFPSDRTPPRGRQAALAQMRARWPRAVAQRDALWSTVPNIGSTTTWTPLGPRPIGTAGTTNSNSGRLNTIAVHPTNPDIIYVGGAQGGVWKTTNGGASWIPLTDSQCSLAMGSVVLDPVNPEIVYAGTGEQNNSADSYYGCGVLRSTNGGLTWTELGKAEFDLANGGRTISRVVVDKTTAGTASATVVLVAASNGIWRSANSGLTWTQAQEVTGRTSDLVADPVNAGVYYAATGVAVVQNGANTTNAVFKSTDSGLTWLKVSKDPFPTANVGRINLAISASSPETVYAAIQDLNNGGTADGSLLGIFVTTDGGSTWTSRAATPSNTGPLCGGGQQCWYDMVIAVDPTAPNTVYFGGFSLYKSTDGAATFIDIGTQIHVDQHGFTFHPTAASTIFAGNDGGIFKSVDAGTSWTSLNTNLELTQFYAGVSTSPTSTTTVLGGTQDNGTLQWGGSAAWPMVLGGDGGYTAIDQLTGITMFAETQWTPNSTFSGPRRRDGTGFFNRKIDGINIADRAQFIPPLVMDRARPRILFFGTLNLYRTGNSGDVWTNIGSSLVNGGGSINAIGVAPSDSLTVYTGSSDGRVSYTHDLGLTWSVATGPAAAAITDFAVDPRDARTAIVVLAGFLATQKVWRTTDGGTSWTNLTFDLPNIPVLAVVLEPGSRDITIGTDLGVFTLRSGTSSWVPIVNGLPNVAVFDLVFDAPRSRLIAATHGRGMFSLDVTITGLRGDVTGPAGMPDGTVSVLDAQAILSMVVGNAPPGGSVRHPNADANCDGQVTAVDALIVLRKAAGIVDANVCVGTTR